MSGIAKNLNEQEFNNLKYVNNFFARLNSKVLKCSEKTKKIVCDTMNAILEKNKKLIFEIGEKGLPDELPILRAYIWKILLNYLPEDPEKWEETLRKKRMEYNNYKQLIEQKLLKEIKEKKYKSRDELEQIIKDAYRTNTQIPFFLEPTNKGKNINEIKDDMFERRKNCTFNDIDEIYYDEKKNETHIDVLKRILFVYTKFCADISYHQGMNELLAPIYYIFSYDKTYTEETEENIEADSFWCFYYLMSKVSLSFVSPHGEGLQIKSFIFEKCLEYIDKEIADKLEELGIKKEYYCYKWFILLYSQEFQLNDTLKLWDLIFSQEDKYYYVIYIGIAFLLIKKDVIIGGDMCKVMQSLHDFKDIDIDALIKKTKEINQAYKKELDNFILKTKKIAKSTGNNTKNK
jgi:hypothetical protein